MNFRALWIDLGVWLALAAAFVGVLMIVTEINRPPTSAELRAQTEHQVRNDCQGWPATAGLHPDMRDGVCQCMVARSAFAFGGLDDGDFAACRQRVAARMTKHAGLDSLFEENFPRLCGRLEGRLSGRPGDGAGAFCGCLGALVRSEPVAKALYAFGNGEEASPERDTRLSTCAFMLPYGEGWKSAGSGKASMRMPPFLSYQELVLRCDASGLVFEVLAGNRRVSGALGFFDEDGSAIHAPSDGGAVSAPASYGLFEALTVREDVTLQTEEASYLITLAGFSSAAASVAAQCPEPVSSPVLAQQRSDLPDPWISIDAGHVAVRDTAGVNWWGSLVCNASPTYLTLQGEYMAEIIEQFADPSGQFLADGVPVTLAGDGGELFSDDVFCDWGANEGDTESCFVLLDKTRLDKVYGSGTLSVTLAGHVLDPVAFASSPAVTSVQKACYRNAEPLG